MEHEKRALGTRAAADLLATVALGIAAILAGHRSFDGTFAAAGSEVTFALWALTAALAVHGLVYLVALGVRVYQNP